jgi:hypothetical protein
MIGTRTCKDKALDRLTDGIAQLTSSDTWRSWRAMQARVHKYSFSNTVLILAQHPTPPSPVSGRGSGSARG